MKKTKHPCDICDYKAIKKGDLKKHLQPVHVKIKNYLCNQCDKRFAQHGNLRAHIKSIHENI